MVAPQPSYLLVFMNSEGMYRFIPRRKVLIVSLVKNKEKTISIGFLLRLSLFNGRLSKFRVARGIGKGNYINLKRLWPLPVFLAAPPYS